ncbi:MAG: cytochrome-c oxidase, cbb3-type subunit II [Proteobacteria bacterium]|nr:cytochrome-c oxidase, cbb3-type subunit II [Pseudomonadota bacterium]
MINHSTIEKNIGLMGVLIAIVVSMAGIAQIVPLMFQTSVIKPHPNLKPYTALELAGRNIYIAEGCYNCHSQQIRPFVDETLRYGHYSQANESVYDRPFQWGSKRTGPDLHRVGGKYSDEWHEYHLIDPRSVVPESNMPGYPWLAEDLVDAEQTAAGMKVLHKWFDTPYTDEQLANAYKDVEGKTKMEALIAYLQVLGTTIPRSYK